MSPKRILIASLAVFIVAVAALTIGGKHLLSSMEQADATISYLDLARQATDKRRYEQADAYYKQALNFAGQTESKADNLALALGCYSDFLRLKRNPIKDVKLAKTLDERARVLQHKTF